MKARDRIPGLAARELASLVGAVSPGEPYPDERSAIAAVARVALSAASEPGDTDAVSLVAALGAPSVLNAVTGEATPERVLSALEASEAPTIPTVGRLRDALARWRGRLPRGPVWAPLERAAHVGARLVTPEHSLWPETVDDLDHGAPLALWIRGDPRRLPLLSRSVALVGARAASGYGEHVALESAAGLSDRGFAIVSGGAYGVDAAAHRAALSSDQVTAAFLAGGVDRLYPAGNDLLLKRVARDGLLLAELPPGSTPTRWRFLMRNRLIAAASSATIVVEAGARSGSLNTAGHAAQLGRPLGAVPGPITSKASEGCHRLIREYAATCVTTPDEMAELADPFGAMRDPRLLGSSANSRLSDDSRARAPEGAPDERVRAELSASRGRRVPDLAERTSLGADAVIAALGRLSALSAVEEAHDGWRRA
ncbi:DNA-processing protein DprA [Leifsonia sp. McL0607]|uniref:DNA-processing protein DprA n=1 Tax=Leifsonia sp. McL0607 TaxID=3415672 RepID=UPI003CFA2D84